jgi:hypothetical protein
MERKFNGIYQLLDYSDDVNVRGDNIDTIKAINDTRIGASNESGLKVSIKETRYIFLSRHQNARQ